MSSKNGPTVRLNEDLYFGEGDDKFNRELIAYIKES